MKKAAGSTNVFVPMHLRANSTVTDFDITYTREGDTPSAKVDMTAGTIGTHTDNTAVYIDPTNAPELVQICPPDAAFAPGVDSVVISIHNPEEGWHIDKEIQLVVDFSKYQGAVWLNPSGSAGTVIGINGTPNNNSSVVADAVALALSTGLRRIKVFGNNFASQNLSGFAFESQSDSPGNATSNFQLTGVNTYEKCGFKDLNIITDVDAVIMPGNTFLRCSIQDSAKLGGLYRFCEFPGTNNYSLDQNTIIEGGTTTPFSGSTVSFSYIGTVGRQLIIGNLACVKIRLRNMTHMSDRAFIAGSTIMMVEVDASCTNASAQLYVPHGIQVINNGDIQVIRTGDEVPANMTQWDGNPVTGDGDWAELQTDVDDILTDTADVAAIKAQTDKMNFNANDYIISALANVETIAVDQITQNIGKYFNAIKTGTTQSGGHTTTSINSNANFDEADAVIGSLIVFQHNAGDNAFAARVITANGEANGVIEFSPALPQIPPDGAQFIVVPAGFNIDGATLTNQLDIKARLNFLRNGTAQAGAAGSITLDAGASAVDDFYNQLVVGIISGTGAGQAKRIAGYNGTTKVATVDSNWATTPDATSVFTLFPFAEVPVDINAIRDAILSDSTPFNGADIPAIKAKTDNLPADPASETNVDDNEVKIDQVITDIAALNNISVADVLAQINAALDASNTALTGVPNAETGSIREWIQLIAYIVKLGKIETSSLQTLLNEAGAAFASRSITPNPPTDVTVGKLS